jgi:dihydrofolate synthase/folylpolyglutamate synthase
VTAGVVDDLSLDRMRSLVAVLGDPQAAYPVIHLTGTNGKGSTARMLEALLRGHGLSVGMYTSPHLERLNERLVWDGRPIEDEELAEVLSELATLEPLVEGEPTWFELVTAAAFAWFAQQAVDVAVVEVGLLGRYDATNVADGLVAVVTNVGQDHTDGVGEWRRAVASEKAGIIKPGSTLVLGETSSELRAIFESEEHDRTWLRDRDFAAERNRVAVGGRVLDVRTPSGVLEEVFLPVYGEHQGQNLSVAIAAAEAFFDRPLDPEVVASSLADLQLPGRFEIMGREPLVVLDGAHNPDGVTALTTTLHDDFATVPVTVVVLGILDGRDPDAMVEALELTPYDVVIATTPPSPRALPATEVAAAVERAGIEVEVVTEVPDALERAKSIATSDDRIVVTGSLYVVGAARAALDANGRQK